MENPIVLMMGIGGSCTYYLDVYVLFVYTTPNMTVRTLSTVTTRHGSTLTPDDPTGQLGSTVTGNHAQINAEVSVGAVWAL
ncbi:hypothetical protein ElyMa_000637600, partial [Elysia marginata]